MITKDVMLNGIQLALFKQRAQVVRHFLLLQRHRLEESLDAQLDVLDRELFRLQSMIFRCRNEHGNAILGIPEFVVGDSKRRRHLDCAIDGWVRLRW